MKRTVATTAAALIIGSALCLGGCGDAQPVAESTTAAASQTQAATQAQSAAIPASDAVFSYNGVSVELNSDMETALASLGEATAVESQLSCHGVGDDKTYTYDGFVVNTYPVDGKDYVLEVVVSSESIPTSKGVKVGDSASAVVSAYGSGYREVGIYYAYDAGDGKSLQFLIENDTVKEIDYYYNV